MPAGKARLERSSTENQLIQGLRLFDATTILMGSMIGSGIFMVAANMARDLKSPGLLLVAWGLTAVMTVIGAVSYGELAAAMPRWRPVCISARSLRSPLCVSLWLGDVPGDSDRNDRCCRRGLREVRGDLRTLDLL